MLQKGRKKEVVRNLVVVSDLHAGDKLGLCPPFRIALDDGGFYLPSNLQLKVWDFWRFFHLTWVPEATKGEPYVLCCNGDAVDGVHHNSVSQISHNMVDQVQIAHECLSWAIGLKGCIGYIHLRGTESHVGPSSQEDERLARMLGSIPNKHGQFARYSLDIRIGSALVNVMHHIGTTGSSNYEASALNREFGEAMTQAAMWGRDPPDIIVRSHRHTSMILAKEAAKNFTVVVTPCWQLKTPYSWRMAGARQATPEIGGALIRCGDREAFALVKKWRIIPDKVEAVYVQEAEGAGA